MFKIWTIPWMATMACSAFGQSIMIHVFTCSFFITITTHKMAKNLYINQNVIHRAGFTMGIWGSYTTLHPTTSSGLTHTKFYFYIFIQTIFFTVIDK